LRDGARARAGCDRPWAAFFIPGVTGNRERIDDAYDKLRASIELELGHAPRVDRIFKLCHVGEASVA
jgi:hypothetical protein